MPGTIGGDGKDTYFGHQTEADFVGLYGGDDYAETFGGHDYIDVGEGNNTAIAGDGNDRIYAGQGDDWLSGGDGDDYIADLGGTIFGEQHMFGGAGNDTLSIAGSGYTYMYGGTGDDTYRIVRQLGIEEFWHGLPDPDIRENAGEGYDTIELATGWAGFVMPQNIEALIADNTWAEANRWSHLGGLDDTLLGVEVTGNALNNKLTGSIVRDILRGGAGNDTIDAYMGEGDRLYGDAGNDTLILGYAKKAKLVGGTGNDTYVLTHWNTDSADSIVEKAGEGVDTIELFGTTIDLNRANLTAIENIRFSNDWDSGSNTVTGNGLANVITAQSADDTIYGRYGNDVISGGAGRDRLHGEEGNDRLHGGTGGDHLFGGAGDDLIHGDGSGTDAGDWASGGDGNDKIWGLGGNDWFYGDAGNDELTGGQGNDKLDGGSGNDSLRGDAGQDVLIGGLGVDRMEGGLDADRFVFNSIQDSTMAAPDKVVGFQRGLDRIDLSAIDANAGLAGNQAFQFAGNAKPFFTSAGDLWVETNGVAALVYGDLQGDGVADFRINVFGATSLGPEDFIL